MNPATILMVLGSSGLSLVLVAGIDAIRSRRKFRAESERLDASAADLITKAASGVVSNIRADNDDLRARLLRVEGYADRLRDALQVHAAWDYRAAIALEDAGITMPPPPPLYPPLDH